MATAKDTLERLNRLKSILLDHPEGITLKSIIELTGHDRQVVQKDLKAIGAMAQTFGMYTYEPNEDEVRQAQKIIIRHMNGKTE